MALPSMAETRDFLVALFASLFPDRNVGTRRSYHSRRITVLAGATTQIITHVDSAKKDAMPHTAPDDGPIDEWGNLKGVYRKAATGARKAASARVRGNLAGAPVDAGTTLRHEESGLRFKIVNGFAMPLAPPLFVDADIEAISTGSATRLDAGQVLIFDSAPPNIENRVTLVKALDEDGYDREQFGAYRRRILDAFADKANGGRQSDYVKWMLEVAGIASAYAYPNRAGLGTVDLVALQLGSGTARIPDSGKLAEVLDYVRERAPAHLATELGAMRMLTPEPEEIDVVAFVYANGQAAYTFDWDDSAGATVLTWNASTRELTFSGSLPASLKAGHRLTMSGANQDGREWKISALASGSSVILEKAPDLDPTGANIYSGGPLVTPIRDALLAHLNGIYVYSGKGQIPLAETAIASTVGLEVLAEGIGSANPEGAYGTWVGDAVIANLSKIAMYKGGVRNVEITIEGAGVDFSPTDYEFPNDDKIGLLVPATVVVRNGDTA